MTNKGKKKLKKKKKKKNQMLHLDSANFGAGYIQTITAGYLQIKARPFIPFGALPNCWFWLTGLALGGLCDSRWQLRLCSLLHKEKRVQKTKAELSKNTATVAMSQFWKPGTEKPRLLDDEEGGVLFFAASLSSSSRYSSSSSPSLSLLRWSSFIYRLLVGLGIRV